MSKFYIFIGEEIKNHVWQDKVLETGKRYPMGDFEAYKGEVTDKVTLFLLPTEMFGSDYSDGGLAALSNHKAFLEMFGNTEGVYDLYGGFNSYGVAIRADVVENNSEIKIVLDGLEEYPIMDEEVFRKIETEWECAAMKEVVDDLSSKIDLTDLIPDCEKLLENLEAIEQLAWDGVHELNLEFSHESNSAFLNYERVQPYVEDKLLLDHCKDLPLLINREWSCEQTRKLFEEKIKNG
jgi:hypothetical protein